jgi:Na+-driven multidrug efflux pump
VAAYAAASALSAYFTHHLGRPHWAGGVAALSLALNAAGCSWAVPAYGMAGAAASTSLSYGLAILVALALFVRRSGLGWGAVWRGAEPRQ